MSFLELTAVDSPAIGKTVARVEHGLDESGYPFAQLVFSDGTCFRVEETGQCGSIAFSWFPDATIR